MKGRKEYLLVASDKHICIHYLVSLLTDAQHDSMRPPPGRGIGAKGTDRSDESANRSNSVNLWTAGREWYGTRRFAGMLPLTHLDLIFMGAGRCYRATDGRRRGDHFHLLICPALPLSPSLASQAINVNRRSVGGVIPPRSLARRRVAPTPEPFSVESKFSATPKAARRSGRGMSE